MTTLGERMKLIRENNTDGKLSMAAFGDKLGVSSGAVSQWENNQRVPSNAVIHSIVKEFRINEEWIRTGAGEMLAPVTRESEIADITAKLIKEDNPVRLTLQKLLTELPEAYIQVLYETAKRWVAEAEERQNDKDND